MKILLPYLDFWLDCWLIQIKTSLWRTSWGTDTREYIVLDIRIFREWGFRIRLYETSMRLLERSAKSLPMKEAQFGGIDRISGIKWDDR